MQIKSPEIIEGIKRLNQKLTLLRVEDLAISPYNKVYLRKHLAYLEYIMMLNGVILQEAFNRKPDVKVLCDYGGGTGLLGLLAKECFDCRVVYTDIYPEACKDVVTIAHALGHEIDFIVEGDIHTMTSAEIPVPEVMVSRDVVEHIYDPGNFFETTRRAYPDMVQIHNTAANVYNIIKRSYFRKIHHQCEWEGDPDNLKETDHQEPFYQLRYEWIRKKYHSINDEATKALAMITRGLTFDEMEDFVFLWLDGQRHEDPYHDRYPYNTCDPFNGNWAERLLYFDEYQKFGKEYECRFIGNFYNTNQHNGLTNLAAQILNLFIRVSGRTGKYIWPSFNLVMIPRK